MMNIDLDKLEHLAEAATPGIWRSNLEGEVRDEYGVLLAVDVEVGNATQEDTDFIAAANPAVVLELVRRLREAEKDAERLDWLDATNKRFSMGWRVGVAPVGNVNVSTVVFGKDGIRTAIDAAKAEIQQAKSGDCNG